jgi:hypothetical protein
MAQGLGGQLGSFLFPLWVQLGAVLNKLLVRTFLATIEVMITFGDRASQQLEQWRQAGEEGLVIWDESVWEKPESQQLEGLCAVR